MSYFIYILGNHTNEILYTGVTNNLQRRVQEHRDGRGGGFTGKYHVNRLLYFEQYAHIKNAIAREKQIKSWSRKKKNALIKEFNPKWIDLFEAYGGPDHLIIWNFSPRDRP